MDALGPLETKRVQIGPPTAAQMVQTTRPSRMTSPTSAPSVAVMAMAAGCGGSMQWTTCSEMPIGTPMRTMERPVARATLMTSGIRRTKPTWKNTGMPVIRPTTIMAQFARFWPKRAIKVRARRSAPPEVSSILPRILPNPSTVAKKPSVLPIPASMDLQMPLSGIPVTKPT